MRKGRGSPRALLFQAPSDSSLGFFWGLCFYVLTCECTEFSPKALPRLAENSQPGALRPHHCGGFYIPTSKCLWRPRVCVQWKPAELGRGGTVRAWCSRGVTTQSDREATPGVLWEDPPEHCGLKPPRTQRASPLTLSSSTSTTAGSRGAAPRGRGGLWSTAPALPWGDGSGLWHQAAFPKGERAGAASAPSSPRGPTRLFVVLCVNIRDQRCS